MKIKYLLLLISFLLQVVQQIKQKPEDFKGKEPRLIIEEYLSGNIKAWGIL